MATGINGVISLLQAINIGVTGINSAPEPSNYPRGEINTVDMPMCLIQVGDGSAKRFGFNLDRVQHSYIIWVICANTITGIDTEQMFDIHDVMDEMLKTYLRLDMLQAPSGALNEIAVTHPQDITISSFEENLIYNGNEYQGFTLTVPVHEKGLLRP
jgi:hypothetical protein